MKYLWFDNDATVNLRQRCERAARHYRTKYKLWALPMVIFVNAAQLAAEVHPDRQELVIGDGLEARSDRDVAAKVLPWHLRVEVG